ncbi:hypothetical protein Tco_1464575, partial [Tanacetum coccineum]
MSQDQSIPRRNKVDWHMANDDPILTTMRFIPQHEVLQKYDAILPDNLTNQAIKESEAYKTYFAFATRKVIPKPKYVRRSTKEKTEQAPEASSGKRLKATAKVTKSGKKKQPAKGLETLSEVALTEAEQMKIALERSKTQQHSSHASGSGADKGNGITLEKEVREGEVPLLELTQGCVVPFADVINQVDQDNAARDEVAEEAEDPNKGGDDAVVADHTEQGGPIVQVG